MPDWIHTLSVACSGAYRGGATGVGIVVQQRGAGTTRGPVVHQVSEAHASIPTLDAESFAILRALEFALDQGYGRIQIRSSANALRKSIRSEHQAGQGAENPLRARILDLARQFAWVDFRLVARRKNQTARRLAREAWETLPRTIREAIAEPGDPDGCAHEMRLGGGSPYDDGEPDSIPF